MRPNIVTKHLLDTLDDPGPKIGEGGTTNEDLLTNLDRKSAVSPVADNAAPINEFDAFMENINRAAPASGIIDKSDIFTQKSPVTQQGYSGQTFSMPTYAPEGFVFPFHILSKNAKARRDQEAEEAKSQASFEYDLAQISDEIHNGIFVDKQAQFYANMLDKYTNDLGSISKAKKYIKDNNLVKIASAKWKNLEGVYNKTFESYTKVLEDTDAMGQSKYDPATKKLAQEFGAFISDLDNFDPDKLDEYSKFYNKLNQRASISELAQAASARLENVPPEGMAEAVEIVASDYLGSNVTPEQSQLFKESLMYFGNKLGADLLKSREKAASDARLQQIKDKGLVDRLQQKQEGDINLEETKQEGRMDLAEIKSTTASQEKKGRVTISDQKVSVTDPNTGENINIDAKNVITFPPEGKVLSGVPGDSVYVYSSDPKKSNEWLTLNENVDIKPIREFTAKAGEMIEVEKPKEINLTRKQERQIRRGEIPDPRIVEEKPVKQFFNADQGKERTYVLAEINAKGTTKYNTDVIQDVVNGIRSDGTKVSLGGKYTVLIPKDNIKDMLVGQFGKNYDAKETKEKEVLSVKTYNEKAGTNYTLDELKNKYGDRFIYEE